MSRSWFLRTICHKKEAELFEEMSDSRAGARKYLVILGKKGSARYMIRICQQDTKANVEALGLTKSVTI